MLKKYALTALASGAMIVALAPTASADDSVRQANCTAIGGTFVNGSSDSQDRCNVTSRTSQTLTGTTTSSTDYLVPVGEVYLGEGTFEPQLDQATTDTVTVYGEWAVISVENGALIPGTCVTTGKNKGSVQKCQYEKITTEQRTNTVTTTTTTPVLEITQVLQDTETVVTNTTPTTVRTTITTVSHQFRPSTSNTNPDALASSTSSSTFTDTAGQPVVEEIHTPDEEPQVVDTKVTQAEPIVDSETTTVTEDRETVTPTDCKKNKSRSSDRDNACPTP